MKKLISATGAILLICLFTSVYFAPVKAGATQNTQSSSVQNEEDIYVIKAEDNLIVVYKSGESKPYIKTDTFISSLPKTDRRLIEQGVQVRGENALKRALEDYCF